MVKYHIPPLPLRLLLPYNKIYSYSGPENLRSSLRSCALCKFINQENINKLKKNHFRNYDGVMLAWMFCMYYV